jgi:biotin carboxyl carrier protein
MIHAKVLGKTYDIEWSELKKSGTINGSSFQIDQVQTGERFASVVFNHKSFRVEWVGFHRESKTAQIKVNGNLYDVALRDRYDDLLHSLGLEDKVNKAVKEVKAPMPGMVLKVLVAENDEVQKDSPLVILEAMKMENVIKSPAAGKIKKIGIQQGQAVEKNALLVEFAL